MGNIGSRVKSLRTSRKITQEALSREIGVNRSLISKIEKGHSSGSLPTLEKLAAALGVSMADLVSDRPECGKPGAARRRKDRC